MVMRDDRPKFSISLNGFPFFLKKNGHCQTRQKNLKRNPDPVCQRQQDGRKRT
jgi:hypothetical protein